MPKKLLTRAAEFFSLPEDAVSNVFHMELIGTGDLYLENYKGILEYSDTEVVLHGGDRLICIRGRGLNLCAMNEIELRICGFLDSISFSSLSGGDVV